MKTLGHLFLILFIIVVILGFYIGTELSERELGFRNPLEGMPLNSWEFNFGAAMMVWFSGSGLLIAAMVFYWMDQVTDSLAGMKFILKEIAGNTRQVVVQQGNKSDSERSQQNYSKPNDDPRFPRFRDELNYDYWERVKRATQNK